MKASDYKQSMARKILVYGPPKSGKTDKVAQLAETKKLWWFDLEDGFKTVIHSPRIKPEWLNNIEVFRCADTPMAPIGLMTLLKVIKGGEHKICDRHGAINCLECSKNTAAGFTNINVSTFTNNDVLVIDSASQLVNSSMNWIAKDIIAKENFDWKPGWDEYGKQGFILNRIYGIVQQAFYNVVCISHEELTDTEVPGQKKITPVGGTSNFSKTFAKFFDDIAYCYIENGKHKIATSSTYRANIITGSRAGKELEKMDNPSLLELFN